MANVEVSFAWDSPLAREAVVRNNVLLCESLHTTTDAGQVFFSRHFVSQKDVESEGVAFSVSRTRQRSGFLLSNHATCAAIGSRRGRLRCVSGSTVAALSTVDPWAPSIRD